jgi:hypothetical protein
VVAVADDERERRPERPPVPEPGEHFDLVLLDLLSRTAPVALLAAPEVGIDRLAVQRETRGQPFHDRDEGGTVRFACRDERKKHAASVLRLGGWSRSGEGPELTGPFLVAKPLAGGRTLAMRSPLADCCAHHVNRRR